MSVRPWNVSGSGERFRDRSTSSSTIRDGSPRRDFVGLPVDADDVAEMHVDLAGACRGAQELDPAAAVDEVEEDELAHVSPRQHAAREPPGLGAFLARLDALRLLADARDLVAVREPLRRRAHGHLTIAQACGPFSGVDPSRTTSKPCPS